VAPGALKMTLGNGGVWFGTQIGHASAKRRDMTLSVESLFGLVRWLFWGFGLVTRRPAITFAKVRVAVGPHPRTSCCAVRS
jgi:hypothetical protein